MASSPQGRVLVVDDEPVVRSVLCRILSSVLEVRDAASAEEALEILARESVDVIVSDKNMPGMDGLEFGRVVRERWPSIRFVLMTAYGSIGAAQQAIRLGIVDFLPKPFGNIQEVRERIVAAAQAPATRTGAAMATDRIEIYEGDAAAAERICEAVRRMGLRPAVGHDLTSMPRAVIVSCDGAPTSAEVELAKRRGVPFVVLVDPLTTETAIECLRAGASACFPKLLSDVAALSRELSRALHLEAAPRAA